MARLTEEQLFALMLELMLKKNQLLVIQTLDLVRAIQRQHFQHAFNNHKSLERVVILRGMCSERYTPPPKAN